MGLPGGPTRLPTLVFLPQRASRAPVSPLGDSWRGLALPVGVLLDTAAAGPAELPKPPRASRVSAGAERLPWAAAPLQELLLVLLFSARLGRLLAVSPSVCLALTIQEQCIYEVSKVCLLN